MAQIILKLGRNSLWQDSYQWTFIFATGLAIDWIGIFLECAVFPCEKLKMIALKPLDSF